MSHWIIMENHIMNKWIIKFLTGAHQGAEIPLKDGIYKIGCADTDDLTLTDAALVENHFTLHLNETSAEISLPKEREPIFIGNNATNQNNNEQDSSGRHPVIFPQIISVGTLKMVIGLKTENWQNVSLPEIKFQPEKDTTNSLNNDFFNSSSIIISVFASIFANSIIVIN